MEAASSIHSKAQCQMRESIYQFSIETDGLIDIVTGLTHWRIQINLQALGLFAMLKNYKFYATRKLLTKQESITQFIVNQCHLKNRCRKILSALSVMNTILYLFILSIIR